MLADYFIISNVAYYIIAIYVGSYKALQLNVEWIV